MHLKDYYKILELEPSATLPEIKKAYRKLAQEHHPDKNNNDPYHAAIFTEIKEAYEVLTNPAKKEYYLQQRWYNQSIGKRKTQSAITPVTILKQSLELEKYVSRLDVFRMDKKGLQEYLLDVLSNDTIEKLLQFNEVEANRQIISTLLHTINPLSIAEAEPIIHQLQKLAKDDAVSISELNQFIENHTKKKSQEKYTLPAIIIITIILCLLIFLAGR